MEFDQPDTRTISPSLAREAPDAQSARHKIIVDQSRTILTDSNPSRSLAKYLSLRQFPHIPVAQRTNFPKIRPGATPALSACGARGISSSMDTSSIPVVRLVNSVQKPRQHRCLPAFEVYDWPCSRFIERAHQIWPDIETCILRLVTATGSTFNVPLEEKIVHLHQSVAIVPLSSSAAADFEHYGYLELIPSAPENDPGRPRLNLRIPVCGPDDEFLYLAVVKVYAASSTNRFIEKILNIFGDIHRKSDLRADAGPAQQFEFFCDNGHRIDAALKTKRLLSGLLNGQFFVRWLLDRAERSKVIYRVNPIQEFFDTEPEMVAALAYFEEGNAVWAFLGGLAKFMQADHAALLRVGQRLRQIHVDLLAELNRRRKDFFFPIGEIMFRFLDVITREYVEYARFYRPVEKELHALKAANNSAYVKAAKVFRDRTETDVSDILMRPIQRLPRYRMLFQTVYKYTQIHHPDYFWVKKCLMRFEIAQKKADRQADRDNLQLRQILAKLDTPREVPPDTILLDQFTLQSDKKKWRFVFLSTGIWILFAAPGRLAFRAAHDYSDFTITDYGQRSVVVWENTKKWDTIRTYDLQNDEIRDELTARYRGQYRLQSDGRVPPLPVKWSVLSSSSVHDVGMVDARFHHCMVVVEKGSGQFELILFGGLTGSNELTDATYRLVQQSGAWTVEALMTPVEPCPRYHAAMVSTPRGVFLFGGTVNGKDGLADFWRLTDAGWEEIVAQGDLPPPGFALHLSYFPDDTVLLTGGISAFSFYKYSLAHNAWTKVPPRRGCELPPYIGHQVFPIRDATGLIVNGHTLTGTCNDAVIQFTDWGSCEFTFVLCRGMSPIRRVWGSSGMIGSHIVVIGGERECEPYVLDLRDQVWHFSRSLSLEPPVVYGAAVAVFQNRLYVHGGCDDTSSVQTTLHEGILEGQSSCPEFSGAFKDDMWRREAVMQTDVDEPEPWIDVQDLG
jgi:hypothetical protein